MKRIPLMLIFILNFHASVYSQYCASASTTTTNAKVHRVHLIGNSVTINNPSVGSCVSYSDFTAIAAADLTQGSSYTVNITQGTCGGNSGRYTNAWIDWNNDNDFADAGEMLGTGTTINSTANFITAINFSVPATAFVGNVRMRVMVNESNVATNPCDVSFQYGETEDYTVQVVAGTPMSITSASVSQLTTGTITNCATIQPIVKLTINTTGTIPLNLTQIQTNQSGTATSTAFSSSSIYFTGTSNVFSTTTLFGSATVSSSTYNINGNVNLTTGANYFWLVYDLNNSGALGATVDAIISQFTASAVNYNSSSTPAVTITDPAGNGTISLCPFPGGVSTGLETWLRADMGTFGVASMTGWTNQAVGGTATNLNGNPALNITGTAYNYNPYIDFAAPVGTLDGGIAANRQCILLNGFSNNSGINYRSLFFAFQLNDLTRVNTHCATIKGVTTFTPGNGTLHGSASGSNAILMEPGYDPLDFGGSSAANTWQRNGLDIACNSVHSSTKHVLSAVCQTAGSTTLNAFLGCQNDLTPFSSFVGHVRDWKGPAAEIIAYTSQVTAAERQKIDSYLAIKYGITLTTNYVSTSGATIYTTSSPYVNNIIGIGRDDIEALTQKQSHYDSDEVRIYLSGLAATNSANNGSFSSDLSYVVMGDNNGLLCATTASNLEIPTGLTNCTLYSRLEKEWKVTRTNMGQNYNMDVSIATCGMPGSVTLNHLRFLVDDDGNFSNGGTQCYYNGDGTGIVISYANPYITISNIGVTHIPNNNFRFVTIASIDEATPLPVELLNFRAEYDNNNRAVNLKWNTQSEHNSDYFDVQKLQNNEWITLDVVKAKGESQTLTSYASIDPSPVYGENYYRLKQVDLDGNITYSEIRLVDLEMSTEVYLFPNPAQDRAQIVQKGIANNSITILDESGRKVAPELHIISEDSLEINTGYLANGVYLIYLENHSEILKLIVKH